MALCYQSSVRGAKGCGPARRCALRTPRLATILSPENNPVISHFRRTIRELGWLDGFLYALNRSLVMISGNRMRLYKYYFVAQPVPETRWLSPRRGKAIEVRQIAESDPIVREFPRPDWVIPYRFKQGAVCLAAFKAGGFIGFLWLTLGAYQEDEVRCRYAPPAQAKAAWDFDVYLAPEHRLGVAFLRLWDEANSFFRAREINWSLSRISAFNRGSVLSHARMGATRLGSAVFLRIGSWQIMVAAIPPYFHLSTYPGSFPTLVLSPQRQSNAE